VERGAGESFPVRRVEETAVGRDGATGYILTRVTVWIPRARPLSEALYMTMTFGFPVTPEGTVKFPWMVGTVRVVPL
jgi:hypothetical protein